MARVTRSRVGFESPVVPKIIEPQLKLNDTITKYLTENTESEDFANHTKDEVIKVILKLKYENSMLKDQQAFMERANKRLEDLERNHNLSLQYQRRDSVEITGIPEDIANARLEDEVIKMFNSCQVVVNGNKVDKSQIQGCHRKGKKGKVILKTLNRKLRWKAYIVAKI